jgi:hypothetical protein
MRFTRTALYKFQPKFAQIVAQPVFCKKYCLTFTVEIKKPLNLGYCCQETCLKWIIAQWSKIRQIWSLRF